MWLVNVLYFFGLMPQIYLNHKLKSVSGMSDFMLFGIFSGYATSIFYVFCLNLPGSYKVFFPLGFMATGVMVGQRFYYDKECRISLFCTYMFFLALCVLCIPLSFKYTNWVGHAAGWIAMGIWAVYQLPQAVKMYLERSTRGFSFAFATLMAAGVLTELISATILSLPLQTILSNTRGLLAYVIFCIQFYVYNR